MIFFQKSENLAYGRQLALGIKSESEMSRKEFYSKKNSNLLSSVFGRKSRSKACMAPSFLKRSFSQRFRQQLLRPFQSEKDLLQTMRSRQENSSLHEIKLYDAHNIEACQWPQSFDGQYAQKFLTPLIQKGVSTYVENIRTDLRVLVWNELALPVTVNEAEYDNAYVCSPYSYYISCAEESLDFLTQAWMIRSMNALLWGTGKILRRYQINKVVIVNNWFYSTTLYPLLQPQQLVAIAHFLQRQFPDYAIIFRSVDPHTSPICYQTLQHLGFDYIANRQIFFIDPHQSTLFDSRIFRSDLKLLKNSGYEAIDGDQLTESDLSRLLELYYDLYLHKYSSFHPKFTKDFLRLVWDQKLMHFKALKKEGRIDGVVGFVQRNGIMQCPLFGYDRTVPQEVGLYRSLCTLLTLEAYDRHLLFHQSAGASTFKKIRKAQACIEYTAVYCRHLKWKRQIPWLALKSIYNSIGKVYMQRY